jgi:hypothetical protein
MVTVTLASGCPFWVMTPPRSTAVRPWSIVPALIPVWMGLLPEYKNWVELNSEVATSG